jgi:hypothetical protein
MSGRDLAAAVERLGSDAGFAVLLATDPDAALREFTLTDAERAQLLGQTGDQGAALLTPRLSKSALLFGGGSGGGHDAALPGGDAHAPVHFDLGAAHHGGVPDVAAHHILPDSAAHHAVPAAAGHDVAPVDHSAPGSHHAVPLTTDSAHHATPIPHLGTAGVTHASLLDAHVSTTASINDHAGTLPTDAYAGTGHGGDGGVLGVGEAALSLGRDVIGDVAATFGSMLDTLAMSMVGGVTSTASLGSDAVHRLHP